MKMRSRRRNITSLHRPRRKPVLFTFTETRSSSVLDFFKKWITHITEDNEVVSVKPGKPLSDLELNQGWSPEVVLEISYTGLNLSK